jgi:hypothetical protein
VQQPRLRERNLESGPRIADRALDSFPGYSLWFERKSISRDEVGMRARSVENGSRPPIGAH